MLVMVLCGQQWFVPVLFLAYSSFFSKHACVSLELSGPQHRFFSRFCLQFCLSLLVPSVHCSSIRESLVGTLKPSRSWGEHINPSLHAPSLDYTLGDKQG